MMVRELALFIYFLRMPVPKQTSEAKTIITNLVMTCVLTLFPFAAFFAHLAPANAQESQPVEEHGDEKKIRESLKLKVTINARSEFVWSAVHDARTKYPGLTSAKMISEDEQKSVFEQTFQVPFIGYTNCTFALTDYPPGRLEYKLLQSTYFSVLDGTWILIPGVDGHSTDVEVSCNVAGKGIVPRFVLKMILSRKLAKQVDFVKAVAENKELETKSSQTQGKLPSTVKI